LTGSPSSGEASGVAKRGKDVDPPFSPDEILIQEEFVRQWKERGRGRELGLPPFLPAVLQDPKRFEDESRARRVVYGQIAAHPRVKIALLLSERLRNLALRIDALLVFHRDPTGTTDRAVELAIAPLLRELAFLCAPYEGTLQRQRDKLIDYIEWAGKLLIKTDRSDGAWSRVVSTLRFELSAVVPGVGEHVTDEDFRRAISVFLPKELRPHWDDLLPKWDQLALLIRKGRLGIAPPGTIRTEYTRRRSAQRRVRRSQEAELKATPIGTKWDHLRGDARERVKKQIMEIEAKALSKLDIPTRKRPDKKV
jgi:hypothetical protein